MFYHSIVRKFRLNSFRSKAILSFLIFLGLLTVWIGSYFYIHRKDKIAETLSISIIDISRQFDTNINNYNTFFYTGYKNAAFYNKSESSSLYLYLANLRAIPEQLQEVEDIATGINVAIDVKPLLEHYRNLRQEVLTIVAKMERRGFENFGIEGEMREKAERLLIRSDMDKTILLELRQLEKDFLLSAHDTHVTSFNNVYQDVLSNRELSDSTRILLRGYSEDFRSLVNLSKEIGDNSESALHERIKSLHSILQKDISDISTITSKRIEANRYTQSLTTGIISTLLALALVLLILYLSKDLTQGVATLNENIEQFISSDFKEGNQEIKYNHNIAEIASLFSSYQKLKDALLETIEELKISAKIATDNASYKTQFLSKMSHEMRTPLNGIHGMLHLLKSEGVKKGQEEYIEIAERSTDQLLDLIGMILDHSKLETGNLEIEEKPVDLENDIALLMRIFEYQAREKGLGFEYTNTSDRSYKVYADTLRLQQVLMNLIKNAIKFTQLGKITIQIQEPSFSKNKQHLRFIITDTGIGMEKKDFERLFLSFEQIDNSKTREYDGAGLGLSHSYHLLELMGSQLCVESKVGVGTTFYFDLSFKKDSAKGRKDITQKIETALSKNPGNTHALVVEDNLINQKVIKKLLAKLQITCDLATNGKVGVDLFKENAYDLILMDLNMPVMGGIEATKLIKSLEKYAIQTPPIIAVTAAANNEDASFVIHNGLDEYIGKPIDFNMLKSVIKKYYKLDDA